MYKKLVRVFVFLMASVVVMSASHAAKLQIAMYYPPGGGTDAVSKIIQSQISQHGVDIELVYLKTCSDAIKFIRNNPESFMMGPTTDYNPSGTGQCILNAENDGIKLYTSVSLASIPFCARPGLNIAENELWNQPLTLGVSSDQVVPFYFQHFLNNTLQPHNIRIVRLTGGGAIIRAAMAGDIDLWAAIGPADRLISEGAKCFRSTFKNDSLPFIGELTSQGNNFPELPMNFVLWHTGSVDDRVNQAFIDVLGSNQYAEAIASRFYIHTGIGVGNSAAAQLTEIKNLDKIFQPLR